MDDRGWRRLLASPTAFRGEGRFSTAAYSEFMPPPRIATKPSGAVEYDCPFAAKDAYGWRITAREQQHQIAPGLAVIARQIMEAILALSGTGPPRIGHHHLKNNPYWPTALAGRHLDDERHVFLSPLALAKTQDDKGRVRWTLFGASDQGPARGFWRSFFTAPEAEVPEREALDRLRKIVGAAYQLPPRELRDLKRAGFRILPAATTHERPDWDDGPLPKWTKAFRLENPGAECRFLLTFTPFALLPAPVQRRYLAGELNLLPSPATMVFWGSPLVQRLGTNLPFGDQILLLNAISRHEGKGIRVPQSGWLHHKTAGHDQHDIGLGNLNNTVRRTHRWQRVLRDEDDIAGEFAREDHVHVALFSTHPDDVRLYGKPMARNAQIWSASFDAVLDGPAAGRAEIYRAIERMEQGGSFGYRFFYPPMQVGTHTVFWHRPLAAFWNARKNAPEILDCGLDGYLIAADANIELWPRFAPRLSPPASRNMVAAKKGDPSARRPLREENRPPLTFVQTATRAFELRYWETIADLSAGRYLNKNSGDCVHDPVTQARLPHPRADLDPLAEYILSYYRRLSTRMNMADSVIIGDMPFRWQTDFEFPWMGGWLDNERGKRLERNLITIIPGRNRGEAVIMADHYDTAYMEDVYGDRPGVHGDGARLAARGADDNCSATAALMLGARSLLDLSRRGMLDCDIWLVHLTGEEFPADCLGARALTQRLIEGTLKLRTRESGERDLSNVTIRGVYVLDMIAHNNDRAGDIFQVAPGTIAESLWLGEQASAAAQAWAAGTRIWNRAPQRRNAGRAKRSADVNAVPGIGRHLALKGEVRLHDNPRSTLYNTDGQIFSDAGIPVVLFMENYDINREGYHDSHDTMANIDLDYGSALAAIAIETVARTAAARRS